jgi:hypothetical protein
MDSKQRMWLLVMALLLAGAVFVGYKWGEAHEHASRAPIVWIKVADNVKMEDALKAAGITLTDKQRDKMGKRVRGKL